MSTTNVSEPSISGEMRGREHSTKTHILISTRSLRELRLSKMIVCVVLVSILVSVEAASVASASPSSSGEGVGTAFKSSYGSGTSSVMERAAAAPDTQPGNDAQVKTENASSSVSSVAAETATQKSVSAQASKPEKKSQEVGAEETSSEEKDTPEVPEVTESKTDKVDKPDTNAVDDEDQGKVACHAFVCLYRAISIWGVKFYLNCMA